MAALEQATTQENTTMLIHDLKVLFKNKDEARVIACCREFMHMEYCVNKLVERLELLLRMHAVSGR